MTIYSYTGFVIAFEGENDETTFSQELIADILTEDTVTTLSYSIDPDASNEGDFTGVILSLDALAIVANGFSVQADDPDLYASVGVVNWGASNSTTVLAIEYGELEYILALGGDPFPSVTSAAEFNALNDTITSVSGAPTSGAFAPGQAIDLASLPTAMVKTDENIILGTTDNDTLTGTAGDDVIIPQTNDFEDLIIGSLGDDTIAFVDVDGDSFFTLVYDELNAGIEATITLDYSGVLPIYEAEIDKGANGVDVLVGADQALSWNIGDGMWIAGTDHEDVYNIDLPSETWLGINPGQGNDTINITDAEIVRISYRNSDATSGVNVDLTTGQASNDGYGTTDTINLDAASTARIEIAGTDLNDTIKGSDRDERYILNAGNDTLHAGGGYDRLRYDRNGVEGLEVDLAAGTATGTWFDEAFTHTITGIEEVSGTREGDDVLTGAAGNETFFGNGGKDTITGGAGNDTVYGGDNADTYVFGVSRDAISLTYDGTWLNVNSAEGSDWLLNDIETFVFTDGTLSLAQMAALDGAAAPDVTGTDIAENVVGTSASEIINALDGADWITPGAGSDTIDGGDGRDMVSFFNLEDTPGRSNIQYRLDLDLTAGTAITSGSDVYVLNNVERITATIFADRIKGDAGDNEIRGLGDYDWLIGTEGSDIYDGGTGRDMISYLEATTGVTVNLADFTANTGLAAGDSYTSVERVTGSVHIDIFFGDDQENDFRGLGGYDVFYGSTGGRERYDGGNGSDTVSYAFSSAGVTASLALGYGSGGDAARDLYTSIENLGGSSYDDMLTGDNERNNLRALGGDDIIYGRGGIDRIAGGRGNDTIDGGDGSDYILFSGESSDFNITREAGTRNAVVEWIGSGGGDGTDTLYNVEYLVFDDQTIDIWSL